MQLQQGILFRDCSHSFMFRPPCSLDPQVAPTAEALSLQGGRAVYTKHSPVGYLPRDVASLRIRHKQLIRRDFHPLDCGLVGRYRSPCLRVLSASLTSDKPLSHSHFFSLFGPTLIQRELGGSPLFPCPPLITCRRYEPRKQLPILAISNRAFLSSP